MHDIFKAYRGFVNEDLLTEALEDLGLPQKIINYIRNSFDKSVSEKALTWYGTTLKKSGSLPFNAADLVKTIGYLEIALSADELDLDAMDMENLDLDELARQNKVFVNNYQQLVSEFREEPYYKRAKSAYKYLSRIKKWYDKNGYVLKTHGGGLLDVYNAIKQNSPNNRTEPITRIEAMMSVAERDLITSPLGNAVQGSYQPISALLTIDESYLGLLNAAETIWDAYNIAEKTVSKLEVDNQKIIKFNDGFYWYDLETRTCAIEGERMGHCGNDGRGTLYSLRRKAEAKKESKSYVTIAYNEREDTIYQIKGRENNAPEESLWPYIFKFIEDMGVTTVEENGEHSSDDFTPMLEAIDLNTEASVANSIDQIRDEAYRLVNEANTAMQNYASAYADVYDYGGPPTVQYGGIFGPFLVYIRPEEVLELANSNQYSALNDYFETAIQKSAIGYDWEEVEDNEPRSTYSIERQAIRLRALDDKARSIGARAGTTPRPKEDIKADMGFDKNGNIPISILIRLGNDEAQNNTIDGLEDFLYTIKDYASSYKDIVETIQQEMYNDGSAKIAGAYADLMGEMDKFNEEHRYLFMDYDEENIMEGISIYLMPKESPDDSKVYKRLFGPVFDQAAYIGTGKGAEKRQQRFRQALPLSHRPQPWVRKVIQKYLDKAEEVAKKQMRLPFGGKEGETDYTDVPDFRDDFTVRFLEMDDGTFSPREEAGFGVNFQLDIEPKQGEGDILAAIKFMEFMERNVEGLVKDLAAGFKDEIERLEALARDIELATKSKGFTATLGQPQPVEENKLRAKLKDPKFVRRLAEEIVKRRMNR